MITLRISHNVHKLNNRHIYLPQTKASFIIVKSVFPCSKRNNYDVEIPASAISYNVKPRDTQYFLNNFSKSLIINPPH